MQKKKLLLSKTFYTENIGVTNKNMYLFELHNHSAKKFF